jgi:surface antigen
MRHILVLFCALALAGCGASRMAGPSAGVARPDIAEPVSCVPYVRARSGIALQGDAWQWWDAAAGRYERGRTPRLGSVLVIAGTSRLPSGHLAVVSRVVGGREVLVDHANWASGAARGRIATGQRVVDVSPANDWSLVRVFYPSIGDLGTTAFPARGFIHADTRLAAR